MHEQVSKKEGEELKQTEPDAHPSLHPLTDVQGKPHAQPKLLQLLVIIFLNCSSEQELEQLSLKIVQAPPGSDPLSLCSSNPHLAESFDPCFTARVLESFVQGLRDSENL